MYECRLRLHRRRLLAPSRGRDAVPSPHGCATPGAQRPARRSGSLGPCAQNVDRPSLQPADAGRYRADLASLVGALDRALNLGPVLPPLLVVGVPPKPEVCACPRAAGLVLDDINLPTLPGRADTSRISA